MSFAAERKALEGHFNTAWTDLALSPAVKVLYDNSNQVQPTTDFVYFRIVSGDGKQAEIVGDGETLNRYTGIVQIDVMTVAETGNAKARVLADHAADIFRRLTITDEAGAHYTFRIPSIRVLGSWGERYRVVVTAPYQRDIRE